MVLAGNETPEPSKSEVQNKASLQTHIHYIYKHHNKERLFIFAACPILMFKPRAFSLCDPILHLLKFAYDFMFGESSIFPIFSCVTGD